MQTRGRWRNGVAHLVPYDEAWRHTFKANPVNAVFARLAAREPVGLRVDFD